MNDAHAKVLSLQAELWRAAGLPPFSASAAVTWDPLELIGVPTRSEAAVQVHTMRGEYRAAAVNLANAGPEPLQAKVHVERLPDAPAPAYLTVHEVPWTDTAQSKPVAAALPEARRVEGGWTVSVQPGLLRQLWLTFHVTDLPAGQHSGTLVVEAEGQPPQRVPLELRIWPLDFPRQTTLYLGGWSYTNGHGAYGVTPQNKGAFLEHLQAHFVNAPWATSSVMMKFAFDPSDPRKITLNTAEFDDWIAQWPQARRYCVFANVGNNSGHSKDSIGGTTLGTPEFNERVATWIHAWVEHSAQQGSSARAVGAAAARRTVREGQRRELYRLGQGDSGGRAEGAHLGGSHLPGSDPGPGRTVRDGARPLPEPSRVVESRRGICRVFPAATARRDGRWSSTPAPALPGCWTRTVTTAPPGLASVGRRGATGTYFWAFGDTGGGSSWCEYFAKHGPYCPLFLDDQSVTAGKQMEAIRESVEDYEYFVMLRAAVARARAAGKPGAELAAAETLLKTAAGEVLQAPQAHALHWHSPKDRTVADAVRVRLLEALEAVR